MIPLESLRQSRCDWAANVNNIDCLDSKKGSLVWLGKGTLDLDGSTVLEVTYKVISNTLSWRAIENKPQKECDLEK